MKNLVLILRALRKGVMLSNVETWKSAGVAIAAMTALLSALTGLAVNFGWIGDQIDQQIIMEVSSALVTLVGLVLGYLGIATTEKIGVGRDDVDYGELPDADRTDVHAGAEATADDHGGGLESAGDRGRADWGIG